MPEHASTSDSMRTGAEAIAGLIRRAGFTAYFAGGCVRDMLLGKETPKDYDIATDAQPEALLQLFPRAKTVGAHFGVLLVHSDGFDFEIATFRKDGVYRDGRRPDQVTFSTAEEDAKRRDFTINGMFFDPAEEQVIDFVRGRADLEAGLIRAIGDPDARFREDHLRLLRAIRFATSLQFQIEPQTWAAVRANAPKIQTISVERCRDELVRILLSRHRLQGFDLLVDSGLMRQLIPEILDLQGCEQPPEFHPEGDVFTHTRLMISLLPDEVSLPLVLSVLFHDIGKPATQQWDEHSKRFRFNGHDKSGAEMTESILRRLRFSNEVIDATCSGIADHMKFMHVKEMRLARLKRFMAKPTFDDELELHRVDCLGSNGMLDNYEFVRGKREEFAKAPLIPPRLVTGRDLIELGWQPGPALGAALDRIQNAQLEGQITTREEGLRWLRENEPRSPGRAATE